MARRDMRARIKAAAAATRKITANLRRVIAPTPKGATQIRTGKCRPSRLAPIHDVGVDEQIGGRRGLRLRPGGNEVENLLATGGVDVKRTAAIIADERILRIDVPFPTVRSSVL